MRVSKRSQITIPKYLREQYELTPGSEVDITPTEKGILIQKRAISEHPVDRISGILDNYALGEGFSVDDYIEEIRGR